MSMQARKLEDNPGHTEAHERAPGGLVTPQITSARGYAALYNDISTTGFFFRTRLSRVDALLRDVPAGLALDVGCGPGMMLKRLAQRGWRCVGLDFDFGMVSESKITSPEGRPVNGKIEQLPFRSRTFDVVLAMGVLEYVADAHTAIRELARVMKPDGIVIISMINKRSPYRIWRRLRAKFRGGNFAASEPSHVLSATSLRRILRDAELLPRDMLYFDFNLFPPPLDERYSRRAVELNRKVSRFADTPLRFLGTGFLLRCALEHVGMNSRPGALR